MDFLKFLISRTFFKHLMLAAAIGLVILLLTLVWLKIYTHHGQAITVPDLSGLTLDEVNDVVSARRLRFQVVDSIYSDEMPRGTVLKQNPQPFSKVKVNRRIFITMNAINPEKVTMPHLVELSIRQAKLALENAGLVLGNISYQPDYAVGSVLQQMYNDSVIEEGTLINKGSRIDLILGMGLSNETTLVPDLSGMDLESAKATIADHYLNFGLATFDASVQNQEDSLLAWVYRQHPEYDGTTRINKGMEVFLWLTVDSTLLPVADTLLSVPNGEADNEIN